jgi:hypothetical protein
VKTVARTVFKLNHLPCWTREVEVWGNGITATILDRLVNLNLYLYHRLGCRSWDRQRLRISKNSTGVWGDATA